MPDETQSKKQQLKELQVDPRGAQAVLQQVARRGDNTLASDIERRYLKAGVQLLSDEAPQAVDDRLRARIERYAGALPDDVRLHMGERAQQAAAALGAKAFNLGGKDIFLGAEALAGDERERVGTIAHELTHAAESGTAAAPAAGVKAAEGRAYGVEKMVLAEEQGSAALAEPIKPTPSLDPESVARKRGLKIDMNDLERRVWEILQRQRKRAVDHVGAF